MKGALRLLTEMKKLPGGRGEMEGGVEAGREVESSIRVCRTILRGCLRSLIRNTMLFFIFRAMISQDAVRIETTSKQH